MWANEPEMAEKWEDEEEKNEGSGMKITKRQLRQIIKEEKRKILNEQAGTEGDMSELRNAIADAFYLADDELGESGNTSDCGPQGQKVLMQIFNILKPHVW